MITNLSSKKTRTTPKLAMLMKIDLLQFLPRWVTPVLTPVGELCKERATNIKLKLWPELRKSNIDAEEEEDFVEGDEEECSGPHGEEEGWVGSCTLLFGWLVGIWLAIIQNSFSQKRAKTWSEKSWFFTTKPEVRGEAV